MGTKFVELTSFDRCDVDPVAQGRVLWMLPDTKGDFTGEPLTLILCSHHSETHGSEMIAQGWEAIADNRSELTSRAVGAEVS